VAVATLFVVSVLAAATVGPEGRRATRLADAPGPPTTAAPEPTTTEPAAPTTMAAPTTTAPAIPTVTAAPAGPTPRVLVSPSGVVLPVTGGGPGAWQVLTPCSKSATLSNGTPVATAPVVLDPGHGGPEAGAVGPNGLTEATLNLAVSQHAKAALERAGFPTLLTHPTQYRMTLDARARVALAAHTRAFVSIHHNAEPDGPSAKPGSETYYQVANPESKRLAGLVYEEVARALAAYQVAWVADTDAGTKYRKSDSGDDYYGILRRSHGVPTALAELAFITNQAEADLLARADVQQVEGEAVARGIVRFLTSRDPGSGYVEPYPRTSPAGGGGGADNCVDPAF
jgi:N-acetylmuramoyl-L-alanine amidase